MRALNGEQHPAGEQAQPPGIVKPDAERTIEAAVRAFLEGLGEGPGREGLRKTPHPGTKAFREGIRGYSQNVKDIVEEALFPEAGIDSGMSYA